MPYEIFVENLIKMVPFTADEEEEGIALKGLIFLWGKDSNLLIPYKQRLVQVLENDLANTKKYMLEEPLLSELVKWLNTLKSQ
jgi:hypothetical protein